MSRAENLERLTADIGTETHVSDWYEITQDKIDVFAKATEDTQWIHTQPEVAKQFSPFGSTVAHGFLTLSLLPYLTGVGDSASADQFPGLKLAVNYGLNRVRFPSPVLAGASVRARVEPQSVETCEPNGIQTVSKVTVEIKDGTKPACVAEMISRFYF